MSGQILHYSEIVRLSLTLVTWIQIREGVLVLRWALTCAMGGMTCRLAGVEPNCSRMWALSTLEQPGPVAGLWFSILSPGLDKESQVTETRGGCRHPGCPLGPRVRTNALDGMRAPESTPRANGTAGGSPLGAPLPLSSRCELWMLPVCSAEWQCGRCCPPGWAARSAVCRGTCCIRHSRAGPT